MRRPCDGAAVLDAAGEHARRPRPARRARRRRSPRSPSWRAAVDALADLHVAEAVLGVVKGRTAAVAAATTAAAGAGPPPDFDVVRTPHGGRVVNTVVLVVLPDVATPTGPHPSPAALADPAVAAYLDERAGRPAGAAWRGRRVDEAGQPLGTVTLADVGLRPCDTVGLGDRQRPRRRARRHRRRPRWDRTIRPDTRRSARSRRRWRACPRSPTTSATRPTTPARRPRSSPSGTRQSHAAAIAAAADARSAAAARPRPKPAQRARAGRLARWGITPLARRRARPDRREPRRPRAPRRRGARAPDRRRTRCPRRRGTGAPRSRRRSPRSSRPRARARCSPGSPASAFDGLVAEPATGAARRRGSTPTGWRRSRRCGRPSPASRPSSSTSGSTGGQPLRAWSNRPGDPWQTVPAPPSDVEVVRPSRLVAAFGPAGVLPDRARRRRPRARSR